MDSAPEKTKATGVGAPATLNNNQRKTKNTPRRAPSQPGDGRKAAGCFIGTVLREARAMADENLRRGPGPGIAPAAKRAGEALDSLGWLCDYVGHEDAR